MRIFLGPGEFPLVYGLSALSPLLLAPPIIPLVTPDEGVALQEAVRGERQAQTILANSPVGESECSGRAEIEIRRVKERSGQ